MEIVFLGHSAFRLRGRDVTIVTDPYPPDLGFSMGKVTADIVTISYDHPHHAFKEGVAGDPRFVEGPGEYEIADVLIAGVATTREPNIGTLNTAYVFRFDDVAVCHLGTPRSKLTDEQVEEIGSIDVLLVPVGGGEAVGATEAAEIVAQLEPSFVVPMHYRLNGDHDAAENLEPVDLFCREMGSKELMPEAKLTVTKNSITPEVRLVVLENKRG